MLAVPWGFVIGGHENKKRMCYNNVLQLIEELYSIFI